MSDGTQLNSGVGGDVIVTEDLGDGTRLAVSKLVTGTHGVNGGPITSRNPLPMSWGASVDVVNGRNSLCVLDDTQRCLLEQINDGLASVRDAYLTRTTPLVIPASSYLPSSVPGLIGWWRSDLGITANILTTVATGQVQRVSTWADQSGNSNDLLQATATFQPRYIAADPAFGGAPSVNALSTRVDWLATAGTITYGPFTVFIVGWVGSQATPGVLYHHVNGTGFEDLNGNTSSSMIVTRTLTSQKSLGAAWDFNPTPRTLTHSFDGTHAGHLLRINGVQQATTNAQTNDPGTATGAGRFGLFAQATSSAPCTAGFSEVLLYNASLSAANVVLVEAYLRQRYGHY